jgi:aldehyde:ferredoxin oxidoreductase
MHDPRQIGGISLGIQYEVEPTPGRHTSTCDACDMYRSDKKSDKKIRKLKGRQMQLKCSVEHKSDNDPVPDGAALRDASCMADMVNGLGLCLDAFGLFPGKPPLLEWINGATGWDFDFQHYLEVGRRVKTVRHSFNIMAGISLKGTRLPDRARGYQMIKDKKMPVITKGPNAFRMPDIDQGDINYYQAMGFDYETGVPSDQVLDDLDLGYVKDALKNRKAN